MEKIMSVEMDYAYDAAVVNEDPYLGGEFGNHVAIQALSVVGTYKTTETYTKDKRDSKNISDGRLPFNKFNVWKKRARPNHGSG